MLAAVESTCAHKDEYAIHLRLFSMWKLNVNAEQL